MKILVANPRGFCAGVTRAINTVEKALELFGAPIYVRHEIVHNVNVVKRLQAKGTIFVEEVKEIPEEANVIFSAHGSSPQIFAEAKARNLNIIDATCPLVTKVHKSVMQHEEAGMQIVVIGHKKHVEVIGTSGYVQSGAIIVENIDDVAKIEVKDPKKIAYVTQTTLSVEDTIEIIAALKERFPETVGQTKADICFATTNRQNAVKELAAKTDLILVIGSKQSSNSNRLAELAVKLGVAAYLIDEAFEVDWSWFDGIKAVGITAGASAPEDLVQSLILAIQDKYSNATLEEMTGEPEDVIFHEPKAIRDAEKLAQAEKI